MLKFWNIVVRTMFKLNEDIWHEYISRMIRVESEAEVSGSGCETRTLEVEGTHTEKAKRNGGNNILIRNYVMKRTIIDGGKGLR